MQTRFGVDPYPGFYDNQRLFECTFAVALEQSTWAPPIASRSSERRDQMGGEEAFSFMARLLQSCSEYLASGLPLTPFAQKSVHLFSPRTPRASQGSSRSRACCDNCCHALV